MSTGNRLGVIVLLGVQGMPSRVFDLLMLLFGTVGLVPLSAVRRTMTAGIPPPATRLHVNVALRRRRLAAICVVFLWCNVTAAEEAAVGPLETLTEQYNKDRKRLIAQNLSLTAAEARRFWPLYERYEKDLSVLIGKRQAVITKFGENYDAMTDAMAREILLERLKIEDERHRLRRIYLPRFERVLPIKKLARFYQIESTIRAAVEAGVAEELPLIK